MCDSVKTVSQTEFPCTFEEVTIVNQLVCTGRQLKFQTYSDNQRKIGMHMTANKLHCISDMIGLDQLNLTFVHFKKLAKFIF